MSEAVVVWAADADPEFLLDAADVMLAVARHEGMSGYEALGPREAVAAALRAGLEPDHAVVLAVEAGRGLALAAMDLVANPDRAAIEVFVLPGHRRRGIGRRLLAAVAAAAAANGREVADISCPADTTTSALVAAMPGMQQTQTYIESVWEAGTDAFDRAHRWRSEARAHASDYTVRCWHGPTPTDLVPGLGSALAAMADAPRGAATWQPSPADADALRRRDGYVERSGLRHHVLVAVHSGTGEVAGFTDVAVWPGHDRGEQWDTGVLHAHRGHRLGLLLKAEMAVWLAGAEPALRSLHTANADDNVHMLAVNERLGWRPVSRWAEFEGPLAALADSGGG